jgi:hypothetical protein
LSISDEIEFLHCSSGNEKVAAFLIQWIAIQAFQILMTIHC